MLSYNFINFCKWIHHGHQHQDQEMEYLSFLSLLNPPTRVTIIWLLIPWISLACNIYIQHHLCEIHLYCCLRCNLFPQFIWHLDSLQVRPMRGSASMNILVHVFKWICVCIPIAYFPRSWIAGLYRCLCFHFSVLAIVSLFEGKQTWLHTRPAT